MHLLSMSALGAFALIPSLRAARAAAAAAAVADPLHGHELAPGATVRVRHGRGARLHVDHGVVWLTEQGSFVDLVLAAGESCPVDRDGDALIAVQARARLRLSLRGAASAGVDLRLPGDTRWLALHTRPGAAPRALMNALALVRQVRMGPLLRALRGAWLARARRSRLARY